MTTPAHKPLRIFCSYAHEDEEHLNVLREWLRGLERQGLIKWWHDRQIVPGWEWEEAIDKNLRTAEIILLLVTPDFMASDYVYEKEIDRAIERHERGEARVIPIIVRPSDWKWAPFGKLQALPKDARPITTWPNRDEAWLDVAEGLRRSVEELSLERQERAAAEERMQRLMALYDQGQRHIDAEEWQQALVSLEEVQRLEPGYRETEELLSRVRQELTSLPTVEVPDLGGRRITQAGSALSQKDLRLGAQNERPSNTIPEGQIIDQSPEAGTEAETGSSVDVTVSSGPSTVADPDLAGKRPESGGQVPPVQTPPPASMPTRDQNGGQPRPRVPVWTMAVGAIFVLALIGGIVALGNRGQQGGGGEGAVQELTVSVNFDPLRPGSSENMQDLVEKFNKKYKDQYAVNLRKMPSDSGQYFKELKTEFQRGSDGIDVIGGDVTWPAELAENHWIDDLSDRFPESEQQKFLRAPIQANTYEDKIWGVPWYTDAGMLYYRKDLLKKSGFSSPPEDWGNDKTSSKNTLTRMTGEVQLDQQAQGEEYPGFVFQGANYEGGVVNALEYIYSYGGHVLDPNDPSKVVIDSYESAFGFEREYAMVWGDVAPKEVATYREKESAEQFLIGNAVFCRNWSYMYDLAETDDDYISKDQIGIAPLPAGDADSVSGLGGQNFYISAYSDEKGAAWKFIKFATSAEQQKSGAIEAGLLPTRRELYEDQELLDKVPVMDLGKEAIWNAEPPLVSPYYSEMWPVMAEQFNAALKRGEGSVEAINALQTKLTKIVKQEPN
jgi:multiple sugar transport system substrate-binding protein